MVFKPHPQLRQDVVPQGIAELQDLGDCGQRKQFGPLGPETPGPHGRATPPCLWRGQAIPLATDAGEAETQTSRPLVSPEQPLDPWSVHRLRALLRGGH